MRYNSFLRSGVIFIGLAQTLEPTRALDFNVGLKASASLSATAGLDEQTRNFINSLPEEVRKQVLLLIEQALPLIDTSVQKYLDRVNQILDTQLTHLECVAIGTGQVLGDDLKSSVPLVGPPEPVEKLHDDAEKIVQGFSVSDPPEAYRLRYSDLLYRGATTACQVSIAPQASIEVSSILDDVRPRWSVWYRLSGKCAKAEACFTQTLDATKLVIDHADERDNEAVLAHTRLTQVIAPNFPFRFFGKWTPTSTENMLNELLSIQDGISAAKLTRETVAKAYAVEAEALIVNAEKNLSSAQANSGSSDLNQLSNAVGSAEAANAYADKITTDLAKAAALDPTLNTQVKIFQDRFQIVASAVPQLEQTANKKADQIRAASAAAAAAARAVPQSTPPPVLFHNRNN